jgi:hypothetical protein
MTLLQWLGYAVVIVLVIMPYRYIRGFMRGTGP